jgi:response regulator RpfG family c-di-GMP phosphodiesterase
MPGMNGWEFLDEYDKLDEKSKEGIIICMLTTSYATPDIEKAKSNDCIHSFISKPLTKEKLLTVLENIE